MSYARWSTIVNSPFTDQEEVELMMSNKRLEERVTIAQERNPEAYLSDWYIFWYSCSDDDVNDHTPENQMLALWLAGEEVTPVISYPKLKEMVEKDDWSELGFEIRQKELMLDCIQRWMYNVEKRGQDNE